MADRFQHRVELVRPGPASLAWLRAAVRDLQGGSRLAPVTVVVPSPYLGLVARRALAADGCANVTTMLLRQVADRVADRSPAGHTRQPLTGVLEGAAIRAAVRDERDGAFAQVAHHTALHDALGVLFRELRHLDDPEPALDTIGAKGVVASATVRAYRCYVALTTPFSDVPELARHAASTAHRPRARWPSDLGALVLYLPSRLDEAELTMLAVLARSVPLIAAFPHLGEGRADALQEGTARALALALDASPPAIVTSDLAPAADVRLVSAPDPAEEVRYAVRRVAAALDRGVPLWRSAVLYGQEDVYGRPVRDALDAAEIPWHAALGRPLTGSWAARSLLGLLGLRERRFAREAVLDWLSSRPPLDDATDDPLQHIPISAWDRISRRAQILESASRWTQQCETLATILEREEQRAGTLLKDDQKSETEPLVRDSVHARAIAAAIARLNADTRPPRDGSTWDEFVAWADDLRAAYLSTSSGWPAAERTASEAVKATLASLADAAMLEPTTTLRTFQVALTAALESRRMPEGTLGFGVLVGPVGSVLGAQFDRVHILGAVEGVFPGRPAADPLMASQTGPDPLARHERQRESERRAWLGALAAADGQRVTVSYPRSDGASRLMHPSRWLLELASRLADRAVYASAVPGLLDAGHPWLVRIASAHDGATKVRPFLGMPTEDVGELALTPASLADLRLAGIVAWHAGGGDLARHPLAARLDLPLGGAIRASRARRSWAFTPYDGNLAELAGTSRLMARTVGSGYASATGVERWATCHFQYLLQNILRVQVTQRPEEAWTITPLDRGSLVHAVLEAFFRELDVAGRLGPGDTVTAADHARLDELAGTVFRQLETEGRTGHPLVWENARTAILADLHELIERDHHWREAEGLQPSYFEQTFGYPDTTNAWPAASVPLLDGRAARFRGSIDRVDLSPDGVSPRRALIIDYKTGSASPYSGLEDDPLLGGQHIQLALYARALRERLAGSGAPLEVRAEFRFITGRSRFQRLTVLADDDLDARLDGTVQRVAEGIQRGVFLPVPGEWVQGRPANCRFCDYDRVCSATRDEAWERKHGQIAEADQREPAE